MINDWLETLCSQRLEGDFEASDSPSGDARSAAEATVIAPLFHLGLIRAEGADAIGFLHNLLSNDVNGLEEKTLRRAALCTAKGRMLADFLLWREEEAIILQLSADLLPPILKKLSMYVLRSKVKLSDVSDSIARIGLAGPQAGTLLQQAGLPQPAPMQRLSCAGGSVLGIGEARFEIAIAAAQAASLWQALSASARPVGLSAWRGLDIAAGIPLITATTTEAFVPQMVNYELIGGVGFKKGCYPGQEIVARTQYLGKIKRRMYRAHVTMENIAAGSAVYAPETGEQACGSVVLCAASAQGGLDLLLVAQSNCVAEGEIHLGSPSGPVPQILPLPYALD